MFKRKIAFGTLGCRLNQYESDSLVSQFIKNGYEVVSTNEKADAYIINTCTVTNKSDAKSRNILYRINRTNPNAMLYVTGCYAETDRSTIEKIAGVNYVIGNDKKYDLFNIVNQTLDNNNIELDNIEANRFHYEPAENTLHTRSYLKIQDGCNEHCSYCKIPMARGKADSRPFDDVLKNIENLLHFGYKEIILTGINIGDYLNNNKNLYDILKAALNFKGDYRIHLSSIEPNKITPEILELATDPKICHHLHIPLQSGSDRILKLMDRHYSQKQFRSIVEKVHEYNPKINVTTDVMVGFPGETDNDFNETLDLLSDLNITHTHTFKYSHRDGTLASKIKEVVPETVKSERSQKIREQSESLNYVYRKQFINDTVRVLTEKELTKGIFAGYSDHYFRVQYSDKNAVIGNFSYIKVKELSNGVLFGKEIEK